MANTALNVARILGIILECIGYGAYLVTSLSFLSSSHSRSLVSFNAAVKATVATVLFLIATTHLGLSCYQVTRALAIDSELNRDIPPSLGLSDIQSWDNVMGSVLIVLQCTIGDAIPIYRCFVVYNRSWRVIAPSLILYVGGCVCTAYFIYLQSTLSINNQLLAPVGTAFWAVTLIQNTLSTSLLIYRIWSVNHQFRSTGGVRSSPRTLDAIVKIIAASGFLYTLIAFVTFIAEACRSPAGYPLSDLAVVVVGIAFNLIVTRSAKIFEPEERVQNHSLSNITTSKPPVSSSVWTQGTASPGMPKTSKDDDDIDSKHCYTV